MGGDARDATRRFHEHVLCFSFFIKDQGSLTFLAIDSRISISDTFYNDLVYVTCFVITVHDYSVHILVVMRLPVPLDLLGVLWERTHHDSEDSCAELGH